MQPFTIRALEEEVLPAATRAQGLSRLLALGLELYNVPDERFDFRYVFSPRRTIEGRSLLCGTTACAAGFAVLAFGIKWGFGTCCRFADGTQLGNACAVTALFKLTVPEYRSLFIPDYGPRVFVNLGLNGFPTTLLPINASRTDVAERIVQFCAAAAAQEGCVLTPQLVRLAKETLPKQAARFPDAALAS